MKILNYGSLNLDQVYTVPHMVRAGETLSAERVETFPGGKGLNQSIALARAGAQVWQAGKIGADGEMLRTLCRENGVHTEFLRTAEGKTGHAIIQVDPDGQNCILLFGGSNQEQTEEEIRDTLSHFAEGDLLVLQNEINRLDQIIELAYARGLTIVLNPSPYNEKLKACDFRKVEWFLVNEVEAEQMTGESDPARMPQALRSMLPQAKFVLTLGEQGSVYIDAETELHQEIFPVQTVDTTAAGDTFTGYFLAALLTGRSVRDALRIASKASSVAVSRPGASSSIPYAGELGGSEP